MSGEERTEQASHRQREQMRRQGQGIGRSREFSTAAVVGVGLMLLSMMMTPISEVLRASVLQAIWDVGQPRLAHDLLLDRVGEMVVTVIRLALPFALLVGLAGIGASLIAGGFVLTPVKLNLGLLNPSSNVRRMFGKDAVLNLLINMAKLAVLAVAFWLVLGEQVPRLLVMSGGDLASIASIAGQSIFTLGVTLLIFLGVVAGADYFIQRTKAQRQLRVTKHEARREIKENEGDPYLKAARRERAAAQLRERRQQEKAMASATLLVTNPTELAIALRYDPSTMGAPRIVAKGRQLVARRLRALAAKHDVPIIEDRPLAWSLIDRPVGSEIPEHLYSAVARLIALVYEMRFRRAGGAG